AEERVAARAIKRGLDVAAQAFAKGERRSAPLCGLARAEILTHPEARVEYVKLCDPETLREIDVVQTAALLAVAVHYGGTRLIDNVVLRAEVRKSAPAGARASV
ncbi:MAG: pantoate--beta-alanine ligase, partial [Vicinamibacteria bacterium]